MSEEQGWETEKICFRYCFCILLAKNFIYFLASKLAMEPLGILSSCFQVRFVFVVLFSSPIRFLLYFKKDDYFVFFFKSEKLLFRYFVTVPFFINASPEEEEQNSHFSHYQSAMANYI